MKNIQNLYLEAKKIIPGGTQLLSKRPEMFAPNQWPTYYKKAKGCEIQDIEGKRFIDMCYMGIGSCTLGYADKDVDNAVIKAVKNGSMSTLNSYDEVLLAKLLCKLHPWAEQARFTRSGGEAMSVAVRLARAKTKKDIVLFSGYHGWHDWYLSANLSKKDELADGHLLPGLDPLGVPKGLAGTALPFKYNDIKNFKKLVKKNRNKVAAVIIETIRNIYPNHEFFETIKRTCEKEGIILIFDEITSGFRLTNSGSHIKFGRQKGCCSYCFEPDIAVFAKAMTNGYPLSAIIGKKDVMSLAEQTFVSSLYWTDTVGPAATLATIKKIKDKNVTSYTEKLGKKVQNIWLKAAKLNKIDISITGPVPQLSIFAFKNKIPLETKTLFIQEMLKRKFITTTAFYPSFSHNNRHIKKYEIAINEVFDIISRGIKNNTISDMLKGPVCHTGFKRLT
jgi:glutamate-1-semialdehyde aminotransferase